MKIAYQWQREQLWLPRYLQGWKRASGLRDYAVEFSKEQVHAAFHWRLSDYEKNHNVPFRIFFFLWVCVLLLWPLTVNPFFLQPTAGFIQSWFSASSLEVLQLAYLNWWKIPEVSLLTNGWIVDFSCSYSISLHGSWISYTHCSAENMQCVRIKHQRKNETDKHVDVLFVWHIFPGFCTHILTWVT